MKKGLTFNLKVSFDTIAIEKVETIEFAFAGDNESGAPLLKSEAYPSTVRFDEGTGAFLVPFTPAETAAFPETFYMDTRITLKNSDDQPQTQMVRLAMSDSLFE